MIRSRPMLFIGDFVAYFRVFHYPFQSVCCLFGIQGELIELIICHQCQFF